MRVRSLGILFLIGFLSACKGGGKKEELVAKVNGEGIGKAEFDQTVERNLARYKGQGHALPPGIETRIKESVLRRLIDDKVIEIKAKAAGVEVTPQEIDAKFKEHKDRFKTEEAFQDYLKRSNNNEENMRQDLRRNLLRDRVVEKASGEITVSDEEAQKYYDENLHRFKEKEQIKASRILIRLAPNAVDKETKAAQKQVQDLHKKLTKSNADFGELAKASSNGPEASRLGDLGWLTRGRMPPEFDNIAFNLEAGVVSAPFQSKQGWEIIKVWEKKPEQQRAFDTVKDNIRNSLLARKRNEKRREVLRDLKKDATVEKLVTFDAGPDASPHAGVDGERPEMDIKAPHPPMGMTPHGLPGRMEVPAPGQPPPGEPPAEGSAEN